MKKLKLEALNRMTVEEFKESSKNPYIILLDNIRSLYNVGSTFRTADAFRAEKIFLCGITGTPPHRDIHKTALGATETVNWEYAKETLPLLTALKVQGYKIVAIEQTDNSTLLQNFIPDSADKFVFVFGNEVFGIDEAILPHIDFCLEIPQFGAKHSLNVSVAVGVICWHYLSHVSYLEKN